MNVRTRPLTEQEFEQVKTQFTNFRDLCLFILGIKTGFRIAELTSIKLVDCSQYGMILDEITVRKSQTKGKVASRAVPLSKSTKKLLREYIDTLPKNQVYLFQSEKGNKLSTCQAWRKLKEAFRACELRGNLATHSMRKTFCNKIYEASGKDILITQEAMGHKSLDNTRAYLQVNKDTVRKLIVNE